MASRYIAKDDMAQLATEYGVTEAQVLTFIQTNRENGLIGNIYQYVNANPGASEADVGDSADPEGVIDATTLARILRLLEYSGWVVEF